MGLSFFMDHPIESAQLFLHIKHYDKSLYAFQLLPHFLHYSRPRLEKELLQI